VTGGYDLFFSEMVGSPCILSNVLSVASARSFSISILRGHGSGGSLGLGTKVDEPSNRKRKVDVDMLFLHINALIETSDRLLTARF